MFDKSKGAIRISTAFYFQISKDNCIIDIVNQNMSQEWFDSVEWDAYLDKDFSQVIDKVFVVEIKGKFFSYESIDIGECKYILFNQDGYLKEIYKNVIRHINEGVQVFDRNGYLVYANESSERLENYDFHEYKDKHILDLYNLSEDYSTTLSVLRTGEAVINRCDRFITKDKKELVTINSGYPLKINSELLGVCVFESDLAVIKKNENSLFNLEHFIKTDSAALKQVRYCFKDIVHVSDKMEKCIKYAKKAALSHANVLIVGETGTGKELIAQSIHDYSQRANKPFVDVNCGALPTNLVESIFFGTEKGAFTGSVDKKGLFEIAEGGTLFLDEVNAMDYEMQAKLLRVIQEKRYQKVGGSKYYNCDVRLIASSNEDPVILMKANRLRSDFYYRLANMIIELPPLRERIEDIEVLSDYFLKQFSYETGIIKIGIENEVIELLKIYNWAGNVRELEHVIKSAAHHMSEDEKILKKEHLPSYFLDSGFSPVNKDITKKCLSGALIEFEKQYIEKELFSANGNITKAAKSLGISRQNLQYRIKKHNL